MSNRPKIGLDNPAFQGRLRRPAGRTQSLHAPVSARSRPLQPAQPTILSTTASVPVPVVPDSIKNHNSIDGMVAKKSPARLSRPQATKVEPIIHAKVPQRIVTTPKATTIHVVAPQPFARPAHAKQQRSQVLHRRSVSKKFIVVESVSPAKRYSRAQLTLVAMAGFIFIVGVIVSAITLQTNNDSKAQVAALSSQSSNNNGAAAADAPPSETPPSAEQRSNYQVAPLLPKSISIDKLGIDTRIRPMGVNTKGELEAPANIYDAGWYNASARPGDSAGNGAMLIDGHVSGPTKPGVFKQLKTLAAGDIMKVTRGDNQVFTFKVVRVQNFDAATFDMSLALQSAQPGIAGLNVVTCGGVFDRATNEYEQRTIVFAVQVG